LGINTLLQHGVNRVLAKVDQIEILEFSTDFSGFEEVDAIEANDIGK